MIKYFIPLLFFVLLSFFLYRGLSLNPTFVPSPFIGQEVPIFALPDLLSENPSSLITNESVINQTYLINVWATWCVGCRVEHGFLNEISLSSGLPILGLNWRDERNEAINWLETLGNPYQFIAYDQLGEVAIDFGVYGAPETFLINSDGIILYKHISPLTPEIWQKEFIPRIIDSCGSYPCASL